jgi:hypothetical protein
VPYLARSFQCLFLRTSLTDCAKPPEIIKRGACAAILRREDFTEGSLAGLKAISIN